ncbi:MAG TPA: TetR/AcrR family transcriptional regulator [Candidatus Methylomirabilis sp.]
MPRERRRRQVLQSAKEVFSTKGYHSGSIADIIRSAGIAGGSGARHRRGRSSQPAPEPLAGPTPAEESSTRA